MQAKKIASEGNISSRLIAAMDAVGISGSDLSRSTGITAAYISELRSGKKRSPSDLAAGKLAAALKVSVRWLLAGEGPMDAMQAASQERAIKERDADLEHGKAVFGGGPPEPEASRDPFQEASQSRALAKRATALSGGLEAKLERTVAHIGAALRSWPSVGPAVHPLIRAEIDRQIDDYAAWCEATGKAAGKAEEGEEAE